MTNEESLNDLIIRVSFYRQEIGPRLSLLDRYFSELGLGRWGSFRADMVVVSDHLHGYEIKSDRDSLSRLADQAEAYGRAFQRCSLIVGRKLEEKAIATLPDWWGVVVARKGDPGGVVFEHRRAAGGNPHPDARGLGELLWIPELVALLELKGVTKGVKGKGHARLLDRVVEHYTHAELLEHVICRLRDREKWRRKPPVEVG